MLPHVTKMTISLPAHRPAHQYLHPMMKLRRNYVDGMNEIRISTEDVCLECGQDFTNRTQSPMRVVLHDDSDNTTVKNFCGGAHAKTWLDRQSPATS
jgi:microcystin degradation protein MlrC